MALPRRPAGIAQLVEQAIENRRVPSSNLGPGITTKRHFLPMQQPQPFTDRTFNNADSYAQAFDEAWQEHGRREPSHGLSSADKLDLILCRIADHPFAQDDPSQARQVAEFRVRLLGL